MWIVKNQNNTFFSYLIILLSIFILFLVTYKQYEELQVNLDEKIILLNNETELKTEINRLNTLENDLKENNVEVQKYLTEFSENEVIEYIYDYIEKYNKDGDIIYITDINLSEWVINDLWLKESNINISANVSNIDTMKRFLNFFVSTNSKYNFYIDNFTFPNDSRAWSFNINLPLKIYFN